MFGVCLCGSPACHCALPAGCFFDKCHCRLFYDKRALWFGLALFGHQNGPGRPFFRGKSRGLCCPRAAKCGSVDKNKDRKPRNIRELKAVKKIIKKRQKKVVAEQKKVRMFAPAKTGYVPCLRSSYISCGIGIWESEKTFSKKISKLLCGKKKGFIFAPA